MPQSIGPSDKSDFVDAVLKEAFDKQAAMTVRDWINQKQNLVEKRGKQIDDVIKKFEDDIKKLKPRPIEIAHQLLIKQDKTTITVPFILWAWPNLNEEARKTRDSGGQAVLEPHGDMTEKELVDLVKKETVTLKSNFVDLEIKKVKKKKTGKFLAKVEIYLDIQFDKEKLFGDIFEVIEH